jgi:hypothetical protein
VLKEGEGFVVPFLEHHKRKGMNQEGDGGRTTTKK